MKNKFSLLLAALVGVVGVGTAGAKILNSNYCSETSEKCPNGDDMMSYATWVWHEYTNGMVNKFFDWNNKNPLTYGVDNEGGIYFIAKDNYKSTTAAEREYWLTAYGMDDDTKLLFNGSNYNGTTYESFSWSYGDANGSSTRIDDIQTPTYASVKDGNAYFAADRVKPVIDAAKEAGYYKILFGISAFFYDGNDLFENMSNYVSTSGYKDMFSAENAGVAFFHTVYRIPATAHAYISRYRSERLKVNVTGEHAAHTYSESDSLYIKRFERGDSLNLSFTMYGADSVEVCWQYKDDDSSDWQVVKINGVSQCNISPENGKWNTTIRTKQTEKYGKRYYRVRMLTPQDSLGKVTYDTTYSNNLIVWPFYNVEVNVEDGLGKFYYSLNGNEFVRTDELNLTNRREKIESTVYVVYGGLRYGDTLTLVADKSSYDAEHEFNCWDLKYSCPNSDTVKVVIESDTTITMVNSSKRASVVAGFTGSGLGPEFKTYTLDFDNPTQNVTTWNFDYGHDSLVIGAKVIPGTASKSEPVYLFPFGVGDNTVFRSDSMFITSSTSHDVVNMTVGSFNRDGDFIYKGKKYRFENDRDSVRLQIKVSGGIYSDYMYIIKYYRVNFLDLKGNVGSTVKSRYNKYVKAPSNSTLGLEDSENLKYSVKWYDQVSKAYFVGDSILVKDTVLAKPVVDTTYRVRFMDAVSDALIKEQWNHKNDVISFPDAPKHDGYKFKTWRIGEKNITSEVRVNGVDVYYAEYDEVKISSSSAKSSSSSSAKSSSSSAKSKSSSSSKKDAIFATVAVPQFHVMVSNRTMTIVGAKVDAPYAILDMQGGVVSMGSVASENFVVPMSRPGVYMVRIGNRVSKIAVR